MNEMGRLIKALGDASYQVREEATSALVESGAGAVEPLCRAMRAGNWVVRKRAAWALGQIGDRRAVEPLCAALGAGSADFRFAAAEALGNLGCREALPALRARLQPTKGENNELVRLAVGSAIEKIEKATA